MSNIQKYNAKQLFSKDSVHKKFAEVLGKKSKGFVTSVLQAINDSDMLSESSSESVYSAAMTAAVLDLPINPNLGFAYIIPYRIKNKGVVATFQIGYKGLIQLCQRSGQFKTISATPIYAGQILEENPLTGYEFNFNNRTSDEVIGYAAYFSLVNGFEKTLYMTVEDVEKHAKEYSQSYKKKYGPWVDNFEAMAIKTVLKLLLSKYAPMTIDMEKAITFDQGEVKDVDGMEVGYIDNDQKDPQQPTNGRQQIDIQGPVVDEQTGEVLEEEEEGLPFK